MFQLQMHPASRSTNLIYFIVVTLMMNTISSYAILYVNPNRLDYYKILLRKCIKCDCVITGTPK